MDSFCVCEKLLLTFNVYILSCMMIPLVYMYIFDFQPHKGNRRTSLQLLSFRRGTSLYSFNVLEFSCLFNRVLVNILVFHFHNWPALCVSVYLWVLGSTKDWSLFYLFSVPSLRLFLWLSTVFQRFWVKSSRQMIWSCPEIHM